MSFIKDIIDLLMLRKQEKKLDADIAIAPLARAKAEADLAKAPLDLEKAQLDIDKAAREHSKATSVLVGPEDIRVDDIQKYDPRVRRIADEIRRMQENRVRHHYGSKVRLSAVVAVFIEGLRWAGSSIGQVVITIVAGAIALGIVVGFIALGIHFLQ